MGQDFTFCLLKSFGPLPSSQLHKALGVRPSTIAYSLKQLRKQGMVSYVEDYRHRSGLFDVTAKGMKA